MDIGPRTKKGPNITLSTPLMYVWQPYHKPSVSDTVQASDTPSQRGVPNRLLIDTSRSSRCHLVKGKSCKSVIREVVELFSGRLAGCHQRTVLLRQSLRSYNIDISGLHHDAQPFRMGTCLTLWPNTEMHTYPRCCEFVRDPNKQSSDVTCTTTTRSQFNTPPGPLGQFSTVFGYLHMKLYPR